LFVFYAEFRLAGETIGAPLMPTNVVLLDALSADRCAMTKVWPREDK
jgi:hypothetical protein